MKYEVRPVKMKETSPWINIDCDTILFQPKHTYRKTGGTSQLKNVSKLGPNIRILGTRS